MSRYPQRYRAEMAQYFDDLYHEAATTRNPAVVQLTLIVSHL